MIQQYLENPFEQLKLKDEQLYKFISEHISLLEQANINQHYTEVIKELKQQLEKFSTSVQKPKVKSSKKKETELIISDIHKFSKQVLKEIKINLKNQPELRKEFESIDKKAIQKNKNKPAIDFIKNVDKIIEKHHAMFDKQTITSVKDVIKRIKVWEKTEQKIDDNKTQAKQVKNEILLLMFDSLLQIIRLNINNLEDIYLLYPKTLFKKNK